MEAPKGDTEEIRGPVCKTGAKIIYAWAMDAPDLELPEGKILFPGQFFFAL